MREIVLRSLYLQNFKGIRDRKVEFSKNTQILGANGTGKSTLFDSWLYLLFGKDSRNQSDFEIKTLDADGKPYHNLDHSVEAVLAVDGQEVTLKKVYSEKWTKTRGSAHAEFSGHTTDYYIDGVPVKQKEYKARVDSIADEGVFRLVTSPTYFNEVLDWKTRRKILLEVCGDLSDADVFNSDESLSQLPSILGNHTVDQHRAIIKSKQKEINAELDKIPVRIDEAQRSKPNTEGLSESELSAQVDLLRKQVADKEAELSRLNSGGEVAQQEKRKLEIEAELAQIKHDAQAGVLEKIQEQNRLVLKLSMDVEQLEQDIQRTENRIKSNEDTLVLLRKERERLQGQWYEASGREFKPSHDDTCPTCGQALPEEQVKEANDKALAAFNVERSERIAKITEEGKAAAASILKLEEENESLAIKLKQQAHAMDSLTHQLSAEKAALQRLKLGVMDTKDIPEYVAKLPEYEAVCGKILELHKSAQAGIDRVQFDLSELRMKLREAESTLSSFGQVRTLDQRIADLSKQEKELARQYERLEMELHLCEEFVRAKVNLLETKINSKFRMARFMLFEDQINGGLQETCETTVNGVPYNSLNHAARINAGLDVMTTLSEHYGIKAPVFVDGAESVTDPLETGGQMILLRVSKDDRVLRIETQQTEEVFI